MKEVTMYADKKGKVYETERDCQNAEKSQKREDQWTRNQNQLKLLCIIFGLDVGCVRSIEINTITGPPGIEATAILKPQKNMLGCLEKFVEETELL